jgi:hypothetical protein
METQERKIYSRISIICAIISMVLIPLAWLVLQAAYRSGEIGFTVIIFLVLLASFLLAFSGLVFGRMAIKRERKKLGFYLNLFIIILFIIGIIYNFIELPNRF